MEYDGINTGGWRHPVRNRSNTSLEEETFWHVMITMVSPPMAWAGWRWRARGGGGGGRRHKSRRDDTKCDSVTASIVR